MYEEFSEVVGPGLNGDNFYLVDQLLTCGEPAILDDISGQPLIRTYAPKPINEESIEPLPGSEVKPEESVGKKEKDESAANMVRRSKRNVMKPMTAEVNRMCF